MADFQIVASRAREQGTDTGPTSRTRAALWRKRLAVEARRERALGRALAKRGSAFPPYLATFGRLLRFFGLLQRGMDNANRPLVRQITFAFDALPPAFDGFRILHLSDPHLDDRPGYVEAVCAVLDTIEADLCVITGDFRFNHLTPWRTAFAALRKVLPAIHAREGIAAVLGNHDTSRAVGTLRSTGVDVLVNEHVEIRREGQSLWIAGVDDPHELRSDGIEAALEGVPPGGFKILLAHSPEIIPSAAKHGIQLYLCGHTHGGQMRLPIIGPLSTHARCPRRYAAGPWRYGSVQGYTSTGIGTCNVPIRFNCPPEAVVIELRSGNGS